MAKQEIFNSDEMLDELNKIEEKLNQIIGKTQKSDEEIRLTLMLAHLKRSENRIPSLTSDIQDVDELFQYVKNGIK